jgi:hypothetical protein
LGVAPVAISQNKDYNIPAAAAAAAADVPPVSMTKIVLKTEGYRSLPLLVQQDYYQ